MAAGVSVNAYPVPCCAHAGSLFPVPSTLQPTPGGARYELLDGVMPALADLLMAGAVITDFAIDECCLCLLGPLIGDKTGDRVDVVVIAGVIVGFGGSLVG